MSGNEATHKHTKMLRSTGPALKELTIPSKKKKLQDSLSNAVGRGLYKGQWKHLRGSQYTCLSGGDEMGAASPKRL